MGSLFSVMGVRLIATALQVADVYIDTSSFRLVLSFFLQANEKAVLLTADLCQDSTAAQHPLDNVGAFAYNE